MWTPVEPRAARFLLQTNFSRCALFTTQNLTFDKNLTFEGGLLSQRPLDKNAQNLTNFGHQRRNFSSTSSTLDNLLSLSKRRKGALTLLMTNTTTTTTNNNKSLPRACLKNYSSTSSSVSAAQGQQIGAKSDGTETTSALYDEDGKLIEGDEVDSVDVIYFRGLPQITVPLPSRRERCRFILKPLTNTVGDFLDMLREEDRGIDRVAVISNDGVRIGSANTIEMLMESDFNLVLNDRTYKVSTPPQEKPSKEDVDRLYSVRNLVGQLYGALNVDEHQLKIEKELITELEKLRSELTPMEEKREVLGQLSTKRTTYLTWLGLGAMSLQFGILARLTWWEYSWDIMEPVTYFVTYGTAMLCYAYFVITKQEYILPEVKDRQHLLSFHKNAKKLGLDVEKYNELRDKASAIENDLQRLRDPLALHLPLKTRLGALESGKYGLSGSTDASIVSKAQQKLSQMFKKQKDPPL